MGYRWFDKFWSEDKQVRFPFWFGLSYTTFVIDNAAVEGKIAKDFASSVRVTATITNVGARAGAETIQLYLEPPAFIGQEEDRPMKSLVGFTKLDLQPDEVKHVQITFEKDAAAYWKESASRWHVSGGAYNLTLATSSNPQGVRARLQITIDEEFSFAA